MINKTAMDLIKEFEGFRAHAYVDPVGVLTIGYGTTAAAGVGIVPRLGMTITETDAAGYLAVTVEKFGRQVEAMLARPATPNQFGAMVSLAYNIGPEAFHRSSVLRLFNAGDFAAAGDAFLLWNKGTVNGKKVVLKGLARRREAERALFLRPAVADPTEPHGDPRSDWWAALVAFFTNLMGGKR